MTLWVTNFRKHGKVCGKWAKHHPEDCPFKLPKEVEIAEIEPTVFRKEGQDFDSDGVPVTIPMAPAGFLPASQDDLNYVNRTARTVYQ